MENLLIVGAYLILTVLGLIFMKIGGNAFLLNIANHKFNLEIGWWSLLGMIFYMISFLLWVIILPRFNLSYIMPIAIGIVQVLTLAAALLIFHEKITVFNLLGVGLVVAGVVIMNIK
ncbi:hypothetical protein KKA69_06440 [Patescibacteria group bacterium]|nr:hypothetical protein [Patescibacteria group bacterium]